MSATFFMPNARPKNNALNGISMSKSDEQHVPNEAVISADESLPSDDPSLTSGVQSRAFELVQDNDKNLAELYDKVFNMNEVPSDEEYVSTCKEYLELMESTKDQPTEVKSISLDSYEAYKKDMEAVSEIKDSRAVEAYTKAKQEKYFGEYGDPQSVVKTLEVLGKAEDLTKMQGQYVDMTFRDGQVVSSPVFNQYRVAASLSSYAATTQDAPIGDPTVQINGQTVNLEGDPLQFRKAAEQFARNSLHEDDRTGSITSEDINVDMEEYGLTVESNYVKGPLDKSQSVTNAFNSISKSDASKELVYIHSGTPSHIQQFMKNIETAEKSADNEIGLDIS